MLSSEAMLNMRFHIIINHMHFTLNIFINFSMVCQPGAM